MTPDHQNAGSAARLGIGDRLMRQFSGPAGVLGHVAGLMMARMNVPLNSWVIELLEVGPADRLIDVGCGPGLAVALAVARASAGRLVGVDASATMVRQARWRNRAAIRSGHVEIARAPASCLPFADASFCRACVVNSLQFWPDPAAGLRELHRVLAPAGRLAIALRMRQETNNQFDRRRFGLTAERVAEIQQMISVVGFTVLEAPARLVRGETITTLLAQR